MYQRSNSRVPPIPQPGPTHHDFLLQQQLAAAQHQQLAQLQAGAHGLMGGHFPGPPGAAGLSGRNLMELDAMYVQQMQQQALAHHAFAQSQGHAAFPGGTHHPGFPGHPLGQPDPRTAKARTPAPATPKPHASNPFSHTNAPSGAGTPKTPTISVSVPSSLPSFGGGFPPSASDPLYSMISAEQKLRERERHLYERSRRESNHFNQAQSTSRHNQAPSFSNSIFKQSDLQSSHNFHQPQPAKVAPVAVDKSIASHYPLDLSNAPSRINCENFEPVRVVAPSVQRELDRIKAEKEKRRQLKAQKTSSTSAAQARPRNASTSSQSSKKAPAPPNSSLPNSVPNPPKAQLPPQIQSILSQEPAPSSERISPKIHFPEIGKAEVQEKEKDESQVAGKNESNSNISSSTPLLQNHHQSQHLLAQKTSKLTSGAHTTLTQSKDIIRTHEDYIRCKQERQKVMPPSSNNPDFLSKIYESVLADKMQHHGVEDWLRSMLISESRKNSASSQSSSSRNRLSETGHQMRRRRSSASSSTTGDRQKVQTANVWIPPVDQYSNTQDHHSMNAHQQIPRSSVIRSDFSAHWGRGSANLLYHPSHNNLHHFQAAQNHAQTHLTNSNGLAHSSDNSSKKLHHENKLPLLTEAIRSTDRTYSSLQKNKAETLENLKQQIFRNWNKSGTLPQPKEIFSDSKRPGSPIDDELRRKRSKSTDKSDPHSSIDRPKFNLTDRIKEELPGPSTTHPNVPKVPKAENEEAEADTLDSSLGALEIVEEPDTPTIGGEEPTTEASLLANPDTLDADSDDSLTIRKPKTPGRKQREETPQMKIYKLIKRTPCPPNVKKLSCKHTSGETLLHVAGRRGYLENIAYYLEMGCDVNAKDNHGFTPLHEAVTKGHLNCVKLLLEQGADPNDQAKDGTRPIHDASENGDMSILRMLLSFGADPTLTCYSGESAYDLAEEMSDTKAFLKEYLEYLKSGNKNDELPILYEPRDIDHIELFVKESLNLSKRASTDDLPAGIENLKIFPEEEGLSDQHFKIEISDNPLPESYWLTINEKSDNFILVRDVKNRLIPDKIKPVVLSLEDLIRQVGKSSLVQLPDDLPEEVELLPLNNETTNLIGSKFWSRACA
ncbi:Oidioi.mRNA.OKI2018_I69.PAR.g8933.t2.cds [Oikopleura dioica]|uniref:Oidioi.mRNA.OKI2018_I69.PAR.g8933.t2.cds n=1 Tax=Oikopleura dioica TaxID=34765 RepID=A0ABN7RQT6_OIKDI|nr:Oidioi.mRNA.OKI2018_I69.PAR.g8933.t2.cds [Oikopleura dioica]